MAKSGLPLSKYLPTGGSPVILTVRDTAAFTPSRNGANHLAVDTSSGRCKVTPKDFATVLANMRPDVAVCMAHEVCPATMPCLSMTLPCGATAIVGACLTMKRLLFVLV